MACLERVAVRKVGEMRQEDEDGLFNKKASRNADTGEWSARIGVGIDEEIQSSEKSPGKGIIHSIDEICTTKGSEAEKKLLRASAHRQSWRTRLKNCLCCFAARHLYYKATYGLDSATVVKLPPWRGPESQHFLAGEGVIGPVASIDKGKITLVLDLDETMLHSSFVPVANADFVVPVEMESETLQVYVIKRPWLDYFMEQVGDAFEVVVFTASLSKYADPVLDLVDVKRRVRRRLYREHCRPYAGNFVKDISCLGRDLGRTVLVDNSPHSYLFQPENALPISTFIDDPNDRGLLDILPLLLKMDGSCDVREHLAQLRMR